MKRLFTVATVFLLILSFQPVAAAEKPIIYSGQTLCSYLSEVGKVFRITLCDVMKESRGSLQPYKNLKEAGASYQPLLTAAQINLEQYDNAHSQAVMSGVLMVDTIYAAAFLKKSDTVTFMKKSRRLSNQAGVTIPLTNKLKALLENPEKMEDFSALQLVIKEFIDRIIKDGLASDQQLALFVDRMYGGTIEGVYVITELIAQNDYSPSMMAYVKLLHKRLLLMTRLFNVFQGDPAFAKVLNLNHRMGLIGDLNNIITARKITSREVDRLRVMVTPQREALLAGRVR